MILIIDGKKYKRTQLDTVEWRMKLSTEGLRNWHLISSEEAIEYLENKYKKLNRKRNLNKLEGFYYVPRKYDNSK